MRECRSPHHRIRLVGHAGTDAMNVSSKSAQGEGSMWQTELIVHPSDLEIGHFIIRLDIPWLETPFPLQGVLVDSKKTRDWFIENCQWVVIDYSRSPNKLRPTSNRLSQSAVLAARQSDPHHPINALRGSRLDSESVGAALKAYSLLDTQSRRLIKSFADRGAIEIKTAEKVVGELSGYLERNLAAMVWLTRIKDRDDYTAQHSINCAILALGLAHVLEWSTEMVERAGLAALLHDLGNVNLDLSILNKPGRLTVAEYQHVKTHTTIGYQLLSSEPDVHPDVARVALEHHERPDGLGYPDGKQGDEIDPLSLLVSVVDVYDAVTSHRVYRPARSHHDALGILWRGRGRKFDRNMVETFIHFMGWVAPGTLVKLSSGELAVVEETNIVHGFYPVVRKLIPGNVGYRAGERLDLSELKDDEGKPKLKIAEVLPDGAQGVKVKSLLVSALEQ
jgi:HD-GYP domain-containing protein (c-di-GMP phosphodiesterase class II)